MSLPKPIQQGNFKAAILAHSVNPVGDEAITFEVCVERSVWPEVLVHRWSRNASSSRAIPWKKMLEWTRDDPALPLHLGRNRSGMQSGREVERPDVARGHILDLFRSTADTVNSWAECFGLHKEVLSRYIEPWGWINGVMTMGRPQLMNAFTLRCSEFAEPRTQRLFVNMARLYRASTPCPLSPGEWHLPYVTDNERLASVWRHEPEPIGYAPRELLAWSVARCCWVSYKTVDGKVATWDHAKRRHDESIRDKHMTPLEHQLRARDDHGRNGGCVPGFDCYRHMQGGESAGEFDFSILDTTYKDRDYAVPE